MLNKLIDFLFGKSADIFDQKGEVVHKLPNEKWQKWDDRYHQEDYDWHKHTGEKRGAKKNPKDLN